MAKYKSEEFIDLMEKVFIEDQSQRMSTLEVCEHPWIKKDLSQQMQIYSSFQ